MFGSEVLDIGLGLILVYLLLSLFSPLDLRPSPTNFATHVHRA